MRKTVSKLIVGDRGISGPLNLANEFARHFVSVYTGLTELDGESKQFLTENSQTEPVNIFDQTDTLRIMKNIKKLPNKRAKRIDGIPSSVVRTCSTHLCYPVSILLKKIVADGIFPTKLKQTKIVPVFKNKGNITDPSQHRPVSVTSPFSKAIESCLSEIILLLIGDKISSWQHGFFPGRSITTNLLTLIQYIYPALVEKFQVDVIYTDLSKAFDKVSFSILINRLTDIGLPAWIVKLLYSYLPY